MNDFEKLGAFYLGRGYDLQRKAATDELILYDSKDLLTHALCVGMTGSGKTGLCLSLLEEAIIDGIPVIAIDPKGDLGNLLLTFPDFQAAEFQPWVEASQAAAQGLTVEQLAQQQADLWREGLAEWGQDGTRVARFRDAAAATIYTPGSNAGRPLTVLQSFAPPVAVVQDEEAYRERVASAASGLLALLGLEVDPIRSREHILLAKLLDEAWRAGRSLGIADLIRGIQTPPFETVGVLDVEAFYPSAERFKLAMQLNNLLASPTFAGWLEGESLQVDRLLYTPQGKPRLSIVSIAHLSDAERMFFVTILLSEIVSWMRSQAGTSSLRAILYMDEVFGYFPPTANPPSKLPMLTLLKQARAFGLGVVLATQNPVDLDYKGLSNTGTWLLGRLQTERDKARVLDGLEGAAAASGAGFDRGQTEAILSGLGKRVFLMNNVHDDQPVVFQTRWALSYLRGPLTRAQIRSLTADREDGAGEAPPPTAPMGESLGATLAPEAGKASRPLLPPGVKECFVAGSELPAASRLLYRPALLGTARLHYVDARSRTDIWQAVTLIAEGDAAWEEPWQQAKRWEGGEPVLQDEPGSGAVFAELPAELTQPKNYAAWTRKLKDYLYRAQALTLWSCADPAARSQGRESETEFRLRLQQLAREQRDVAIEKLKKTFAPKMKTLADQILRAEQRLAREKSQLRQHSMQTAISFGSSLLGALLGRKLRSATNVSRAASTIRSAGRKAGQRDDVERAEESLEVLLERKAQLEQEFETQLTGLQQPLSPQQFELQTRPLRPRKSDITLGGVCLAWLPWRIESEGPAEPAAVS